MEIRDHEGQAVPQPADRRHQPADEPAHHRRAAAGQAAVVRQRLGECHRDAGAEGGGDADEEGVPAPARREGGGEERRQGRDGAVHQACESRLDIAQHEIAPGRFRLVAALLLAELALDEFVGLVFVAALGDREVAEQLSDGGVLAARRGSVVEALGLHLHGLHVLPGGVHA